MSYKMSECALFAVFLRDRSAFTHSV